MSIVIIIFLSVGLFFLLRAAYFFLKGIGLFASSNSLLIKNIRDRRRRERIREKVEGLNYFYGDGLISERDYKIEMERLMDQLYKR